MRYAPEHKAESRSRLVRSAARQIRAKGPEKLSVAEVTTGAGLTHGAFYAHFASKDALILEAVDATFGETRRASQLLDDALADGDRDRRSAFKAFISAYLSVEHRDAPERGCPLPSLAADMARIDGAARVRFAAGAEQLSDKIATILGRLGVAESGAEANATLAQMVGAIGLARAVGSSALSEAILEDTFKSISARLRL